MRILQFLSSSAFHGAEAMAAELVRQLNGLGVSVDIAVLDNSGLGNEEIFDAVGPAAAATHRIACAGQLDPATFVALKRILVDRRIDVVHTHGYKTTFYAALTRALRPTRQVTTYHNWLYETRALRMYAMLDKKMARFTDLCVGVSTPIIQELKRHVPAGKVLQIDNGIDVDVYRTGVDRVEAKARLGVSTARPLVGFVGRLSPEKGLTYLLDAIAGMSACDFDLVLVGEGNIRAELEARIQALGLGQRVRLLGSRRDTPLVYAALDVFVLPSTTEAFPMVVLEAMAAGCAVVATDVGEVGRMVEHGVSGLVVPAADVAALRQSMERLIVQPDLRSQLAASAQARVEAQFSSRSMANAYLQAYGRVA